MNPGSFFLLAAMALAAQDPLPADPATPAQIEALPEEFVRGEFYLQLNARFRRNPGRFAFFGDVGPSDGCDELHRIAQEIAARDAAAFRPAYIAAVRLVMIPPRLAATPRRWLQIRLRDRFAQRIRDALQGDPLLARADAEMLRRAMGWLRDHGYAGRRLGYNRRGRPYWENNEGIPGLVCAYPAKFREQVLGDWRER